MKTKILSLAVAVVIVVSDFSVVLAAGIPIGPRPWPKSRNYEKQVSGIIDQLAYIIYGAPRRRIYDAIAIESNLA